MNGEEILESLGLRPEAIPFWIDATSQNEFQRQFKHLFTMSEAKAAVGVVYAWTTKRAIQRLQGASNIIYIGQTKRSLLERHARYAKIEGNDGNWRRYDWIIRQFGPIGVLYARCADPPKMERRLFRLFYEKHLEYPPVNAG